MELIRRIHSMREVCRQARTTPAFHSAPDHEFQRNLISIRGVPPEAVEDDELLDLLMPTLRADFAVFETYEWCPEGALDTEIHAIGGSEDGNVGRAELEGWRRLTSRSFSLRMFPGDHFFVQEDPDVRAYVEGIALHSCGEASTREG